MAQNTKKVADIMAGAQAVSADDPDMMAKLNEIALKVAEAQGKVSGSKNSNLKIDSDPMDELGCEGCQ
jgi:hypothetical protein